MCANTTEEDALFGLRKNKVEKRDVKKVYVPTTYENTKFFHLIDLNNEKWSVSR